MRDLPRSEQILESIIPIKDVNKEKPPNGELASILYTENMY
jgi:hypothetical protein